MTGKNGAAVQTQMKHISTPPDAESHLIAQAIERDVRSIAILYDRYLNTLFNYVYYRVGNGKETELLTEKIFIRLFENLPGYQKARKSKQFLAWVFNIANREIDRYLRTHPKAKYTPSDDHLDEEQKANKVATQVTYLPYVSPGEPYQKESRARIIKHARGSKQPHKSRYVGNIFAGVLSKAPALAVSLFLLLVVYLGGSQVAYVASASLPGDSFYRLKTSIEDAQLFIADDAQDVVLHMQFAKTRLIEVQQLTDLKQYGNIEIAVEGFEQHMELAFECLEAVVQQDPGKGIGVTEFVIKKTAENLDILSTLAVTVPSDSQPLIQQALLAAVQFSEPLITATPD